MNNEEDRQHEEGRQSLPGAIPQEMRAAQVSLGDHLKSLGEPSPQVVPNRDQSGFVVTVSRAWPGTRFPRWKDIWPVEWVLTRL